MLFQSQYVEGTLRKFGMQNSKLAITPMVESFFKGLGTEKDKSVMDAQLHQQMIGGLLYIGQRSRSDILVSVLILAISKIIQLPTVIVESSAYYDTFEELNIIESPILLGVWTCKVLWTLTMQVTRLIESQWQDTW